MQATTETIDHADQQQAWDAEQQREDHARFRAKVRTLQTMISAGEEKVLKLRGELALAKGGLREQVLKLRQLLEADCRPCPLFDQADNVSHVSHTNNGHTPPRAEAPLIMNDTHLGTIGLPEEVRKHLDAAGFVSVEEVRDHAAIEGVPLAEYLANCVRGLDAQSGRVVAEAIAVALEAKGLYSCRVCGCTQDDCEVCQERTGEPCQWSGPLLCSACAGSYRRRQKKEKKAAKAVPPPEAPAAPAAEEDWRTEVGPRISDTEAWMAEVHDPAEAHEEARSRRVIAMVKGAADCRLEYRTAPVPAGVAITWSFSRKDASSSTPWRAYATRPGCLDRMVESARQFFTGVHTKFVSRLSDITEGREPAREPVPTAQAEQTPEGSVTTTVVAEECGAKQSLVFDADHKACLNEAANLLASSRSRWKALAVLGLSDEGLTDALAEVFGKGPTARQTPPPGWESSAAPAFRVGAGGWMNGPVLLALAREVLGIGLPPVPPVPADDPPPPAGNGMWRCYALKGLFPSEQVKQLARANISTAGQLADYVAAGKDLKALPGIANGLDLLITASLRGFWLREVLGGTGLLPDWLRPKEVGRKEKKQKVEAPEPPPEFKGLHEPGGLFGSVPETEGAYATRAPKKKGMRAKL